MKKNIHPKYQQVLFVDSATGHRFVCGSTLQSNETEVFEGVEYPLYRAAISSSSHPFFTGSKALVDSEGRVDKFKKRYIAASQKKGGGENKEEQSSKDNQEAPKEKKKSVKKK